MDMLSPPEKWAVDAALDKSKLQTNLTLVNTIKRLLDIQLQKILSYIIIRSNVNQNIRLFSASKNSCLKKLWLDLFSTELFFQLSYQDTLVSTNMPTTYQENSFCCEFPFSWEIIDQINAVLNNLFSRIASDG